MPDQLPSLPALSNRVYILAAARLDNNHAEEVVPYDARKQTSRCDSRPPLVGFCGEAEAAVSVFAALALAATAASGCGGGDGKGGDGGDGADQSVVEPMRKSATGRRTAVMKYSSASAAGDAKCDNGISVVRVDGGVHSAGFILFKSGLWSPGPDTINVHAFRNARISWGRRTAKRTTPPSKSDSRTAERCSLWSATGSGIRTART